MKQSVNELSSKCWGVWSDIMFQRGALIRELHKERPTIHSPNKQMPLKSMHTYIKNRHEIIRKISFDL